MNPAPLLVPALSAASLALVAAGIWGWSWFKKYEEPAVRRFWDLTKCKYLLAPSVSARYDRVVSDTLYAASDRQRQPPTSTFDFLPDYGKLAFRRDKLQTRLITIEPNDGDDIICSMRNVDMSSLGSEHSFTALSYTWGSTVDRRLVFINGEMVDVTSNLFSALRELKRRGHYIVWVDMLCINQQDDNEKLQQIAQMHNIYSLAQAVVVWIGETDEKFESLLRYIQQVTEFRSQHGTGSSFMLDLLRCWLHDEKRSMKTFMQFERLGLTMDSSPFLAKVVEKVTPAPLQESFIQLEEQFRTQAVDFLQKVREIVERSYWRRAWIMQELTAARELQVWIGRAELDYSSFITILKDMETLSDQGAELGFSICHEHILRLDHLKSRWQPDEPIHMLEAFRDSYHTQSGEKFDEIYALLGMCFNSRRFVPVLNYDARLEDVLLGMTRNHIESSRSLDLICMQPIKKSVFSLPSWAPDWRIIGKSAFNQRMITYLIGQDEHPKPHKRDRRWKAAGSSSWT